MTSSTLIHTAWPVSDATVISTPDRTSWVCRCGEFEPESAPILPPGSAMVWTTGDTESRLLTDVPPPLVLLVLCGPWTAGCEVHVAVSVGQNGRLSPIDLANSIAKVHFQPILSGRKLHRPSLAPLSGTSLPSWMVGVFQHWRSHSAIRSTIEVTALEAGFRQIHGDLDGSHQVAQSIEGAGCQHGDYWHAIMHRREPDYGNSQYWFRRVGRHPVFTPLVQEAAQVAEQFSDSQLTAWLPRIVSGGMWNALGFVDCVAAAAKSADDSFRQAVEEIQYREMLLLFAQTYRDAVGS